MPEKELVLSSGDQLLLPTTRRRFLSVLGVGGAVVFLPSMFTACNDDNGGGVGPGGNNLAAQFTLNLSNDFGILNYAYALEQLEAAYYTAALSSPGFAALSAPEQELFTDLQKHEVIHREFLKAALGTNAIPSITFKSSTVATLTASRDVLLKTSQLLEDTGVSAYNGAGKYISSPVYLLLAGKIVSVEGRHAAAIRDIRDGVNGRLFAGDDVVDPSSGLDVKSEPSSVLSQVVGLNVVDLTASPLSINPQPDATKKTSDKNAPTPT